MKKTFNSKVLVFGSIVKVLVQSVNKNPEKEEGRRIFVGGMQKDPE